MFKRYSPDGMFFMLKLPLAFDRLYPITEESFFLIIDTVAPLINLLEFAESLILEIETVESIIVPRIVLIFFDWAIKHTDDIIDIKKTSDVKNFIYEINQVLQWTFNRKIFNAIEG